jgi:hypothetical protein
MADNTTLNTGSGGDVIASDDIGGVKYQRIKLVYGADGVNVGDVSDANPLPVLPHPKYPGYSLFIPAAAVAANKVWFDLFNASGSGKIIKLRSIRAIKDGSAAVTGALSVKLYMTRTTAVGTGGTAHTENGTSLTAIAISEHDTASAALPAQITARAAPTGGATAGAVLAERHIMPEETNASTYDGVDFLSGLANDVQTITLREGQGLRVVQGSVASVGNIGFHVIFELE